MKNTKKKTNKGLIILGIIVLLIFIGILSPDEQQNIDNPATNIISEEVVIPKEEVTKPNEEVIIPKEEITKPSEEIVTPKEEITKPSEEIVTPKEEITKPSKVKVYFLDVGQADSILIQTENLNMLIDAGNNADGEKLVTYFKSLGINRIDVLVGTHPHEDHIGGMDDIINAFDIGKIYMPKVSTTTVTFEDVLDAISNKGLTIVAPKVKDSFNLSDCKFTVLSIGKDANDLNSCSIVLKMVLGNNSFIFMGDATNENENNMLNMDVEADVIKIGHHGSKTSTAQEFLNKVNPKYAVISVGTGNTYNHPADTTINKLKNKNITIYRTDIDGTLLFESDGNNIIVNRIKTNTNGNKDIVKNVEKEVIKNEDNSNIDNTIVYVTKSGKKYHTATCKYVSDSKIEKKLSEVNGIYEPCSVCNPVTK